MGGCLTPETITRLLASMNAGSFLMVCGAWLSMDPPNSLPSAREVAKRCFYKYRLDLDANCDLTDAKIPPAPVGVPRVVATA
ncbi:hypothetical protein D3C78_1748540 [compost metagenome]